MSLWHLYQIVLCTSTLSLLASLFQHTVHGALTLESECLYCELQGLVRHKLGTSVMFAPKCLSVGEVIEYPDVLKWLGMALEMGNVVLRSQLKQLPGPKKVFCAECNCLRT